MEEEMQHILGGDNTGFTFEKKYKIAKLTVSIASCLGLLAIVVFLGLIIKASTAPPPGP